MKLYVAHGSDFDYENALYRPLRASALNAAHEIFLPHEDAMKDTNTREYIKTCDLLIADVSIASTGVGIEIGRAEASAVPILCIYRKDSAPSRSLRFVTDQYIEYDTPEDLLSKLTSVISAGTQGKSSPK